MISNCTVPTSRFGVIKKELCQDTSFQPRSSARITMMLGELQITEACIQYMRMVDVHMMKGNLLEMPCDQDYKP